MAEKEVSEKPFKPRILVVDDEKRIRDACQTMLTQDGFEADQAGDGALGLKMIEQRHYDIVLLDLMMPGLSGFDVLERIKAIHPDTVIIVITGYATIEHSIEAMKKGAFDFIPKPFAPQDLRVMVAKAIEYIRTLQDIANEKSRMRVLINHLADGVMATDAQKTVALANPAFLKMIGCHDPGVIGRPVTEFVEDEPLGRMIAQALAMPADEFVELTEEYSPEGSRKGEESILGVRCVPFRDRVGRNLGTITVLHDITTSKKVEQLKSDFVSMVAHEIRSPMNSVMMQLKVMKDGLAGDVTDKQTEILGRASEKIQGLVSLATDLLDLAKIESGLISQEKETLGLAALLADQVNFHQPRAQAKNIRLELEESPALPPVLANSRNMEEVLSNLITNAINYTPEGGKVTVSATVEGAYLRVSVRDTGIGMTKEDMERIFDRFYRVKNEKTRYVVGTGLGLPIVKSIVEAHNGMIRIESGLDKGSTFHITIPLATS